MTKAGWGMFSSGNKKENITIDKDKIKVTIRDVYVHLYV